jgi:hypothetical protein
LRRSTSGRRDLQHFLKNQPDFSCFQFGYAFAERPREGRRCSRQLLTRDYRCDSFVSMMQTANQWNRDDSAIADGEIPRETGAFLCSAKCVRDRS